MLMEIVVLATSVLRLVLVVAVYLLNIRALFRLTWQPRSCIHALTTGAVLLAGVLYLSSWAPYIAYTLRNGNWLFLGARRHCLLQYFVAAELGAVLLALLAVRMMYRYLVRVHKRPLPSARAASLVTCLAWLGPQLLYDAVALARVDTAGSPDSYKFVDDLLVVPQGVNASHGYRIGFMICMQVLRRPVQSYYIWQYLLLITPLSALITFCAGSLIIAAYTRRREEPAASSLEASRFGFLSWSRRAICQYGCKNNTWVDMALYYNFIWLAIIRPPALLWAQYTQRDEWGDSFYMDVGGHIILAFSAVFSPFSVEKPKATTEENRLTETVNHVLLKHKMNGSEILISVPDVCPDSSEFIRGMFKGTDSRQPPMDKVGSYENINDLKTDSSVALKNNEKPGEESVC